MAEPSVTAARPTAKLLDHRRRGMLVAALILCCYIPLDLVLYRSPALPGLRLVWIGVILAARAVQRPGRARWADAAAVGAAAASGLLVVATVALAGGSNGPRFGVLLALPLAILMLAPENPWVGAATGVCTGVGGAVLLLHDGKPPARLAEWALVSAAMATLSFYGSLLFRRLWAFEVERERERARMAEELAESERRRASAERLAEVGRLASAAAHDINNPLAALKAGTAWLRQQKLTGDGEVREVLDDFEASVDRIAAAVAQLQRAGKSERDA